MLRITVGIVTLPLVLAAQGVQQQVYRVRATNCGAPPERRIQTAFKVEGLPVLVSALHGVADCRTIDATDYRGNLAFMGRKLTAVMVDVAHDVVQLGAVPALPTHGGLVLSTSSPAAYALLKVYGFPGGRTISRGTQVRIADPAVFTLRTWQFPEPVMSALDRRRSPYLDGSFLDIDGTLLPGHSGAPLLDANDRVVAVANGGLNGGSDNRSWAIPVGDVHWVNVVPSILSGLFTAPGVLFSYQSEDADLPPAAVQVLATGVESSTVFVGASGYIPGLRGRLNPILDSEGRTYLYADNVSLDGGQAQPVTFAINQMIRAEDYQGNRYELRIASISATGSTVTFKKLDAAQPVVAQLSVGVKDHAGAPVPDVDILVSFRDGTFLQARTDAEGVARLVDLKSAVVTVFATHPRFAAFSKPLHDASQPLSIQLEASSDAGSVTLVGSVGFIPLLDGRLNLTGGAGSNYLYADNIALDAGQSQPVALAVDRSLRAEDSHGHRFELTLASVNGPSSVLSYKRLPPDISDSVGRFDVNVRNAVGAQIGGATVLVSFEDGTFLNTLTDVHGVAHLRSLKKSHGSIFIAHPQYLSRTEVQRDLRLPMTTVLTGEQNSGSIIFKGTAGVIPGLNGQINPKLDSHGRMYVYANNIDIDGGKTQPADFLLDEPMTFRDDQGTTMRVVFRAVTGQSVLLDYRKMPP